MIMIPFSNFLQDARQGNYRNIFVKLQECFFVAVVSKRMRDKNVVRSFNFSNMRLGLQMILATEPRIKINLCWGKPRVYKDVKPIKREHPGAVCVEFGDLHAAKIKKASQCKALL